ncbi:winged helix-turn-helix transcriptional regulator [Candidatus Woesearchaeota archaeon]|nr:winged helix-turn-helix transcriptional regulator [Candidatus Woesearchaeota archaeon]
MSIDMNKDKSIKVFKALGEETRFLIVQSLLKDELCACEIPDLIGRTQSNTSMHLAKLHDLGLIKSRKDGKMIIYSIKDEDVIKLLKFLKISPIKVGKRRSC